LKEAMTVLIWLGKAYCGATTVVGSELGFILVFHEILAGAPLYIGILHHLLAVVETCSILSPI
jgi:hypothetical protein